MSASMGKAGSLPGGKDLRLAVGYVDYYALARTLVFVGGIPFLYVLLSYLGNPAILRESFFTQAPRMPWAVLLGIIVSLSDRTQGSKHWSACADIERARRAAAWSWSVPVLAEYYKAGRRHRRELLLVSLVPFAAVLVCATVGGFFGGLWLLAVVFGTEFICWRFLWRPKLLERAAALESSSNAGGATGRSSECSEPLKN